MFVFVKDARNKLGHPTTKCGMIRRLLKQRRAKVLRRYQNVLLVQFTDRIFDPKKTIKSDIILGLDVGYKYIGYSIVKATDNKVRIILAGDLETRTHKIKKLLEERKMYRRLRRRYRRINIKRKYSSCKFRKPIWKNRKKKPYAPTHRHLIQSHLNLVRKLERLCDIDVVSIENFKFDSQKAQDPSIRSWQYQRGLQFGFEHVKSYVRERDQYQCQNCHAKDCRLEVHHIIHRANGGSDRPDNLITLCSRCHKLAHEGKLVDLKAYGNYIPMRDSGVLNSVYPEIKRNLKFRYDVYETYGSDTKVIRNHFQWSKSHAIDAVCIALRKLYHEFDDIEVDTSNCESVKFKQIRRHNRTWIIRHEDRKYYLDGILIAKNRRKKSNQKDWSLQELRKIYRSANVYVTPGKKVAKLPNNHIPYPKLGWNFKPGDTIYVDGKLKVIDYTASRHRIVYFIDGQISQSKKDNMSFYQLYKRSAKQLLRNSGIVPLK